MRLSTYIACILYVIGGLQAGWYYHTEVVERRCWSNTYWKTTFITALWPVSGFVTPTIPPEENSCEGR